MRVIIAGGRDFNDYNRLKDSVLAIIDKKCIPLNIVTIISGGARGADNLGERFADEMNLNILKFQANWVIHGKKAGFIRNIEMAKFVSEDCEIGILIAFWDGKSRGTSHMIDTARKYGIETHIICY